MVVTDHPGVTSYILAVNVGSSSIRFSAYQAGDPPKSQLNGKIDRVGSTGATLTFDDPVSKRKGKRVIGDLDHGAAAEFLVGWLEDQIGLESISAVGHRMVNGGAKHRKPERVTPQLLDELRAGAPALPDCHDRRDS